ncbi:exosome catalytic subunit dis3, partial [Ceratobasidium sp. 370]
MRSSLDSSRLQHLPPSVLRHVATALAPPVLKHTFRAPGHRAAHRSLLAAALTCHALRAACFPLAVEVLRSPRLRPLYVADLGESVRELEARLDFVLEREDVGVLVRKLDIEIYAKAPPRLASKLVALLTALPNLTFISLKLPTYRVFRDALVSDLRLAMTRAGTCLGQITELCVDAHLTWILPHVPNVRELVVWSWPSDVDRDGGLTTDETAAGWKTLLARLNAQAPNVREVEVGGLSVYDVNQLLLSLSNYLSTLTILRILHRKEEYGALALPSPFIPASMAESITQIWRDTDQEQYISGRAGAVKRIVYFDLQDECASCYAPVSRSWNGDECEEEKEGCKVHVQAWEDQILRERYVRDDIACGIEGCRNCTGFMHSDGELPPTGDLTHSAYPAGHFVVPDTNVFLHQMDLMESPLFNPPIILLQTVIDEVRHRSLPLHARLKGLIASEDKKIYVFYNEFHAQTAIVRRAEETPNDRNDRGSPSPTNPSLDINNISGIRLSASWYANHYTHSRPSAKASIVLLTDDAENRRRAAKEGINTLSGAWVTVREYVSGAKDSAALLDLLAAESMEGEPEGMARGGRRKMIFEEGSVNVAGFTKPVLLLGREAMNRSVQGDFVVVELLPESEWKAPADAVIDAESTQRNDNADDSASEGGQSDEEAVDQHEQLAARDTAARNPKEKQPTGRVVGIMKRNWRAYVCHIDRSSLSSTSSTTLSAQTVFVTPVDRALPRIRLRTRQAPSLLGQKILVSLDRWDSHSRYPDGHFVRALGKAESKEAERESLLLEFDVPYRPFGKAILDCLPKEGDKWVVPPKDEARLEWRDREDLRDLIICSIDPPSESFVGYPDYGANGRLDCQDIDDALHARLLPNGNIEAGVHIADVSHFVHPDTPMDNEAAARGTT